MMNMTIIVGAVCLAIGSLGAYRATSTHYELKIAQVENAAYEQRLIDGQDSADLVQEVLDGKIEYKTKWKTKYKEKLVYIDRLNDCTLDDDSLQLWREAIEDASR